MSRNYYIQDRHDSTISKDKETQTHNQQLKQKLIELNNQIKTLIETRITTIENINNTTNQQSVIIEEIKKQEDDLEQLTDSKNFGIWI